MAAELLVANKELAFQYEEKAKRAAELIIANKELAFQNDEKAKRAAELIIANKELAFQNDEKAKRAAELLIANNYLFTKETEIEERTAQLIIAYKELALQNEEKGKRAAELTIANKELHFQIDEKAKRSAELVIINKDLFNKEAELEERTAKLIVANIELLKKETEIKQFAETMEQRVMSRTAELTIANKELEQFSFLSSHDLREPLLTIRNFTELILAEHGQDFTDVSKRYFQVISQSAMRMEDLLRGLLDFSRISNPKQLNDEVDCNEIVKETIADLDSLISKNKAIITVEPLPILKAFPLELKILFENLITNAIKYKKKDTVPEISISVNRINKGWQFAITDNGIGIEKTYYEKIFLIFQRLHKRSEYEGTGIGLAYCKKIAELHGGRIWVESIPGQSSTFYFTILTELQ